MITVVTIKNPLRPKDREIEQLVAGNTLRQIVDHKFPNGIPGRLAVIRNGDPEKDMDVVTEAGDHICLLVTPAFGVDIAVIVVQALIAMAVSIVFSAIFRPKKPAALVDQPAASPVYSISGSQNAARLGEPIPVGYGEFIQVPDFGSQPYTEFVNHDMFLCELLVIGQGDYQIDDDGMMVGDSSVFNLPPGIVQWDRYPSSRHLMQMGVIEDTFGIYEDVVTSPEVGDQELLTGSPVYVPAAQYWIAISTAYTDSGGSVTLNHYPLPPSGGVPSADAAWLSSHPSEPLGTIYSYVSAYFGGSYSVDPYYILYDVQMVAYPGPNPEGTIIPPGTYDAPPVPWYGWFECCKPGQRGDKLMLDFVFPGGLYHANSTGAFETTSVSIDVEYQKINDAGVAVAPSDTVTITKSDATNNVRRYTESIDLSASPGRYRVRVKRDTADATDVQTVDKVVWNGLKFKRVRVPPASSPGGRVIYGDVYLVPVRIKATNGIASAASSRIRFR